MGTPKQNNRHAVGKGNGKWGKKQFRKERADAREALRKQKKQQATAKP